MTIYTMNTEGVLTPLKLPVIKGKDGKDGKNGVTPNITLGEVNTMESGEEVNVIIKGDKENPILDFNLPKGEEGLNIALSSDKIDRKLKKIDNKVKEIETKNEEQEERIKEVEDKEKKQNFYINGLFNENEDGRVSIEEEGNDIKLESSRKGFVEVDKIAGDTLVDRVSEPMRELTLNGDIDTQGTFVSTTETVENGLVDVVCEGDTLVNLLKNRISYTETETIRNSGRHDLIHSTKSDKCFTVITNIKYLGNVDSQFFVRGYKEDNSYVEFGYTTIRKQQSGWIKVICKNNIELGCIAILVGFRNPMVGNKVEDVVVLEGDYTNKPIPVEYFEGMKSVGEYADDNHKIEILSKNKNLFDGDNSMIKGAWDIYGAHVDVDIEIKCKNPFTPIPKTIDKSRGMYLIIEDTNYNKGGNMHLYDVNKKRIATLTDYNFTSGVLFIPANCLINAEYFSFRIISTNISCKWGLFQTSTTYIEHTSNKREISLKEPLRGIPNGVKDRFVKRDGKWFIERNCGLTILDGSSSSEYNYHAVVTDTINPNCDTLIINNCNYFNNNKYGISDKLPFYNTSHSGKDTYLYPYFGEEHFYIVAKKSLGLDTTAKFLNWLSNNPITLIHPLQRPIYEPLETTSVLSCYDEMTHISNNSIIPCNMVVKNTGFSCRALTSGGTYTAVHNGGEGVVAKVDTSDNMVRLSGKGKKVSDVTVVDGNVSKLRHTFKGIQSTFEDKLITQEQVDSGLEKAENLGKYKVNLKVRGKNRFSPEVIDALCDLKNWEGTGAYKINKVAYNIFLEDIDSNSSLTITTNIIAIPPNFYSILTITPAIDQGNIIASGLYNNNTDAIMIVPNMVWRPTELNKCKHFCLYVRNWNQEHMNKLRNVLEQNIMIEIGKTNSQPTPYEPYFEHSKTVYLNSPLYKGDEIVWKEDGLYHYHKMGKGILNGNRDWSVWREHENYILFSCNDNNVARYQPILSDKFSYLHGNATTIPATEHEFIASCYRTGNGVGISLSLSKDKASDIGGFRTWLQNNPLPIIYTLPEPYYEKISDDKLLLEIPDNATLHIDSTIPCQNTKVNYTSRIPSLLTMEDDISNINKCSIDMIANNFDMDYRILEVEWALEDIGINLVDTRRINNTGLSRFHQAKLLITSGEYDKEKLTCQLSEYLERRYLDQEEFNELIDLMD